METSEPELHDLPVHTLQGAVHSRRLLLLQGHPCSKSYCFQKRHFSIGISQSLTTSVSCVFVDVELWAFVPVGEIKAFFSVRDEEVRLTDLILCLSMANARPLGSCLGQSKTALRVS